MCTAVSYKTWKHYFGRNLDMEYSYGEKVMITPRNYPLYFRKEKTLESHFAMIGIGCQFDEYPLYYDAVNEKGLAMAGLSFAGNAVYQPYKADMKNIAPFEFIPWILGQCETVSEAEELLWETNLLKMSYKMNVPLTQLHYILADQTRSIVVEPMETGLKLYENPIGILTNNPPFPWHVQNLCNYMNLSNQEPLNCFSRKVPLEAYSRGMGAIGLPGDLSSASRFVRAAFVKENILRGTCEAEDVVQFFHILDAVKQQKGCVKLPNGKYEYTIYSACCDTERKRYYYRTYHNGELRAVDLTEESANESSISTCLLEEETDYYMQ